MEKFCFIILEMIWDDLPLSQWYIHFLAWSVNFLKITLLHTIARSVTSYAIFKISSTDKKSFEPPEPTQIWQHWSDIFLLSLSVNTAVWVSRQSFRLIELRWSKCKVLLLVLYFPFATKSGVFFCCLLLGLWSCVVKWASSDQINTFLCCSRACIHTVSEIVVRLAVGLGPDGCFCVLLAAVVSFLWSSRPRFVSVKKKLQRNSVAWKQTAAASGGGVVFTSGSSVIPRLNLEEDGVISSFFSG